MRIKYKILLAVLFAAFMASFFTSNTTGEKLTENKSSTTGVQKVFQEVGDKYGVTIIADPSLAENVVGQIQGETVDETLKYLLEPLGYTYTKVENYYIVSGPKSPLTILAEMESCLVPVGFLDAKVQEKLSQYSQYLKYDEGLGLVYVKAPTSRMNQILTQLWEISKTSGELSVSYNLQVIDLGESRSRSDLDFIFDAKYGTNALPNRQLIVTSDQVLINDSVQTIIKQKTQTDTATIIRQPWLVTLPGKTVQMATNLHYLGQDVALDRSFEIKITPRNVDEITGKVLSEIYIGQSYQGQNQTITQSSATNINGNVTSDAQPVNMVSTTIITSSGQRQLLAMVRQTDKIERAGFLFGWFGGKKQLKHHDFAVFVTVTPVNIQRTLATSSGFIPMASLSGLEQMANQADPTQIYSPSVTFGISQLNDDGKIRPWLDWTMPLGSQRILELNYRTEDRYSVGLSCGIDAYNETTLELLAGKGIGPHHQNGVLLGLGDYTEPTHGLRLFAKYFPMAYLSETSQYNYEGVWQGGFRVGSDKLGITLGAAGDPDYYGWYFKVDCGTKKYRWQFEVDSGKDPSANLGLGFRF